MSEFINTVETIGDAALVDCIIDRSITEYKDDTCSILGSRIFDRCGSLKVLDIPNVTELKPYALSSCSSLASIKLPRVTHIGNAALSWNDALEFLDLPSVVQINNENFFITRGLKAVILRNTATVCVLGGSNTNASGLAVEGCYIYVPRALVDSYKAATNWSVVADRFRALEDYTVDGTTTGELDETKI